MAVPCIPVKINHLCCKICDDVLRNPVTIPCGHNFCMQCIEDSWKLKESPNFQYSCPECRHTFPSKPQLIRNTTLDQLVRNTQKSENSSKKRKQQDLDDYLQDLKRTRSCREMGAPENMCSSHRSPLDVYCCTDDMIICAKCALYEHQGHQIVNVEFERRRKQVELKNMQEKFKEILQQQEKTQDDTKKIFKRIQKEARQTKDSCESVLVSVIDSLQKHYLSVKKLIEAQEVAAATKVLVTLQDLETTMEKMKDRNNELGLLEQTESDVDFLQEWASLQYLGEDCLQSSNKVLEDPLLPFEQTKRAVEELGKHLKDLCDKEFASVCQTAVSKEQEESAGATEEKDTEPENEGSMSPPRGMNTDEGCIADPTTLMEHDLPEVKSALTQQNVEPETRAQFLQYACELTLNPDTAHEDLVVSKGDKEVNIKPQGYKFTSVRYPERFMYRRQVLCREGLQAERCYYEVEVEGDKVEIALAYKTIDRKSRSERSAFGGNTKSWSLDRSKNYSVSHNGKSVLLTTSPSHPRIGVYLKFKEGTLSFYEVSDSMKFLYRVEAKFTDLLYPGFWLGEKSFIRICDLRQQKPQET